MNIIFSIEVNSGKPQYVGNRIILFCFECALCLLALHLSVLKQQIPSKKCSTMIVKVENLSLSYFSSVILYSIQFSHLVVFHSLRPHALQHARLPCPSPTPRACSNSCPWSWWCHPTISSSVIPFSSCLQSFPASGLLQWVSSSHQVAKVLEL